MRGLLVIAVVAGCSQGDGGGTDAAVLDPSCMDGTKNGTETDTDCGGSCGACAQGKVCEASHDCANGSCFAGTCADRMWFAESTGNNVAIPGNETWVAAPGASVQIELRAASLVFIRWTGTLRYATPAGNDMCHVGQRFVIDGMPVGHPTWGTAIMVLRGATRWHESFVTELAVSLPAGSHTIAAEMSNANTYATCYLDGDGGQPYDRSQLAVAAYDPASAWMAESTGTTGALGGGSGWVDIPGASLAIPITETSLLQLSVHGSQVAQGAGQGHCAYRLVLDGTPLGDPNHGQAIAVGDATSGWWAPVVIKWGTALNAGTHSVKVQMRNSSTSNGTCEAGQGNNPYAQFRLFATASPLGGLDQAIESTGGSQYLGSDSAWTAIAGLQSRLDPGDRPASVQIEVAGTQRTVTGSGHCAYRLVVDGEPLGDPSHGQMINVGHVSSNWWTYAGLVWGTKLGPGAHDVRVEVRNSASTGDCGVNGDGLPYGRVRMFVRSL